jgi:hypothetical protein
MRLRGRRRVGEQVVDEAEPGAQAFGARLEHMFVTVRAVADGMRAILHGHVAHRELGVAIDMLGP